MEEYTREQIQRADDTDLYVFLSGRGEQFKQCGKEYRWLRHDSVMINKNEWYRFSQNKGGHAIDFMKEFYGLSFAEAVKELLGEEGAGETNRRTAKEDAGRTEGLPHPLAWIGTARKKRLVRLQGSISLSRGNYPNSW